MLYVGQARKQRRLLPCAIPSIFHWSTPEAAASVEWRSHAHRHTSMREVTGITAATVKCLDSIGAEDVVVNEVDFAV